MKEWNASNLDNPLLPKSVELTTLPKVRLGQGDVFSLAGGKVTYTTLAGTKEEKDLLNFNVRQGTEPNMNKKGVYKVQLYDRDYLALSLDVEVVDGFRVSWDVSGRGEIEPQQRRILDGESLSFSLAPGKGYEVGKVTVNDSTLEPVDGVYTVSDVHEDLKVAVEFVIVNPAEVIKDVVTRNWTPIIIAISVLAVLTILVILFFALRLHKKEGREALRRRFSKKPME